MPRLKEENAWRITPVLTGRFGMVRDDIRYRGGNPKITSYVPSVLFLLTGMNRQIVVDTGFGDRDLCERELSLLVERDEPYESIIERAGVMKEQVDTVILTHLHWDHAGMAEWFNGAVYCCHEAEWNRAASHPDEYPPFWTEVFAENQKRLRLIRGTNRQEVAPGIWVQHVGGHTFGSMIVMVQTLTGLRVIAGDVVMTERNYKEDLPVGLCVDPGECEDALRTIRALEPEKVYPSHDFSLFSQAVLQGTLSSGNRT